MGDFVYWLFGIGAQSKDLTSLQLSARAALMFAAAIVMVRIGDKRFLSRKTAFDAVLGFILASMLARAVNGSAPLFQTVIGGFVIVLMHRFLAILSARYHAIGWLIKGRSDLVIKDGALVQAGVRANNLSENDVLEDVRLRGNVSDISEVSIAYMERNGSISIIKK